MDIRLSQLARALAPSATLAVAEKARALRERGVDVVSFGAGEPDFDTPAAIRDAAVAALRAGDTHYPPVAGKPALRAAVCDYLRKYCALDYAPAEVCVTVGAKDAIHLALRALLEPGDEALVPRPYWVSYPVQVSMVGARPVFVDGSAARGGKIGPEALRAALTPRTRVLVLNSPCNPTGTVFTRAELEGLAEVVRGTDVCVVSDEIYHRLQFDDPPAPAFASLPGMRERTVTINGMSKTFAMTGWRLGFAAGPQPVIDAIVRLQGQTTSGAASFAQTAAAEALVAEQPYVEAMRAAYRRRAARMSAALNAIPGVRCVPPGGAFYCFPDVSGTFERLGVRDADGFAEAVLERAHVAVVSGTAFGAPTHARLSFAAGDGQIELGLERLTRLLGG